MLLNHQIPDFYKDQFDSRSMSNYLFDMDCKLTELKQIKEKYDALINIRKRYIENHWKYLNEICGKITKYLELLKQFKTEFWITGEDETKEKTYFQLDLSYPFPFKDEHVYSTNKVIIKGSPEFSNIEAYKIEIDDINGEHHTTIFKFALRSDNIICEFDEDYQSIQKYHTKNARKSNPRSPHIIESFLELPDKGMNFVFQTICEFLEQLTKYIDSQFEKRKLELIEIAKKQYEIRYALITKNGE